MDAFREMLPAPLFADRSAEGRELAQLLGDRLGSDTVVVGLPRGGVAVAAEIVHALPLELEALAARKVRHPMQPEYAIGAVTPEDGLYLHGESGLTETGVRAAVERAIAEARALERQLHESYRLHAFPPPHD